MNATLSPSGITLTLPARTVADLMTPSPVSLGMEATIPDAVACLTDRGISGAPVIDAAGRPVGVLAHSDLVVHMRERLPGAVAAGEDRSVVGDVMTPAVFTLRTDAPAVTAVEHMRALNVHRLFVVDENNVLVGVVTALDILRRLQLPE
jgi:predicted transcriptional regulator